MSRITITSWKLKDSLGKTTFIYLGTCTSVGTKCLDWGYEGQGYYASDVRLTYKEISAQRSVVSSFTEEQYEECFENIAAKYPSIISGGLTYIDFYDYQGNASIVGGSLDGKFLTVGGGNEILNQISSLYNKINNDSESVIQLTMKIINRAKVNACKERLDGGKLRDGFVYDEDLPYLKGYVAVNFGNFNDKDITYSTNIYNNSFESRKSFQGFEWGYYTINDDDTPYFSGTIYGHNVKFYNSCEKIKYLEDTVDRNAGDIESKSISTPNGNSQVYPLITFDGETVINVHIPSWVKALPENWISFFGEEYIPNGPIGVDEADIVECKILNIPDTLLGIDNISKVYYYNAPQGQPGGVRSFNITDGMSHTMRIDITAPGKGIEEIYVTSEDGKKQVLANVLYHWIDSFDEIKCITDTCDLTSDVKFYESKDKWEIGEFIEDYKLEKIHDYGTGGLVSITEII